MNDMNLYYRILKEFSESVSKNNDHSRFIKAAQRSNAENDKLEAVRTRCIIDEEWVLTIEKYLPFVEKAILEDRQFIRQEGDVVRIEKAKKVSKATVSHLARHSDFITHLPEEESAPIIPDKLYITENESNYAVYENRFLYMLLCYTRDFVELRYSKISELGNTYRGLLKIRKHIEVGKRTVDFNADLNEVIKNDPYSVADASVNGIIERLEAISIQISSLLNAPLMNEVSKAPMLRPPITRTNVLRMDNNFKNAVALYDYLSEYSGAGYEIKEIKKSFAPFEKRMAEEIFKAIAMLSHLTYKYGNGIEEELEREYQRELLRLAEEEKEKKKLLLEELRKRARDKSGSIEEYLIALEDQETELKENAARLAAEKAQVEQANLALKDEISSCKQEAAALTLKIGELEQDKIDIEKRAIAEKEALNAEKEEIREQCKKAIFENSKACEDKINGINEDHAKKERSLREEISSVNSERKKEKDAFAAELSALNARAEESREVNLALNARLHAYQWKNKDLPNEDLTERENFKQLEAEREWFAKMFKENWAKTKKRIRDEVFSGAFEPAEKEDIEEPLPDTESEFMLDTEESEIEKAEDTAQENEAVIK